MPLITAILASLLWLAAFPAAAQDAYPITATAACNHIKDLAFVAHQDDDLLFMNPDLRDTIAAGGCVRTVYLTASDRGEGEGYMLGRERGVRAAYAYMAGVADEWAEDTVRIGLHHIVRFTLSGNPRIQLWHLRLKDPWLGRGWGSLTPLSQIESVPGTTAEALGPYRDSYTRESLVSTLARIIRDYRPTAVRHMDDSVSVPYTQLCWRCAGHDHPDHIASARLVLDAMSDAPGEYAQTGYVDYPTQEQEANLTAAEASAKTDAFRRYAWNDYRYCASAEGCHEPAGPAAVWVGRTYYVSRPDITPAALLDTQSRLVLAVPGDTNDAVNVWHSAAAQWQTLGGRTSNPVLAYAGASGQPGLIARDTQGRLWHTAPSSAAAPLAGWLPLAGLRTGRLPAIAAGGHPALLALAHDGLLYWTSLGDGNTGWAPWQALPALPGATHCTALLREPDGGLRAFAADTEGRLYTLAWRDGPLGAWTVVTAPPVRGSMAALRDRAGKLELYVRARDTNHLIRLTASGHAIAAAPPAAAVQPISGHGAAGPALAASLLPSHPYTPIPSLLWQAPQDLGITTTGRPAIALTSRGTVAVAWLEQPGGTLWMAEAGYATPLPATASSPPALLGSESGLYLVARSAGAGQQYQVLVRRDGAWHRDAATTALPDTGGSAFAAPAPPPATAATALPATGNIAALAWQARPAPGIPGQKGNRAHPTPVQSPSSTSVGLPPPTHALAP